MNRPTSSHSAARAFARVGWSKLLASLHRFATGRLRLAAIDAERADVVEACDLVNMLVMSALCGALVWNLPEDATDDEIIGYACTKMYGMLSNLRRQAIRTAGDDALDERADEAPDALSLLVESRAIGAVIRALEDDAEASSHLRMILEGNERPEIMSKMGCSAAHVDMVRKRIVRGIAALHAKMNDESEHEPPSSGPRGRHHVQATEERQGAPPEPDRGADRARGRR